MPNYDHFGQKLLNATSCTVWCLRVLLCCVVLRCTATRQFENVLPPLTKRATQHYTVTAQSRPIQSRHSNIQSQHRAGLYSHDTALYSHSTEQAYTVTTQHYTVTAQSRPIQSQHSIIHSQHRAGLYSHDTAIYSHNVALYVKQQDERLSNTLLRQPFLFLHSYLARLRRAQKHSVLCTVLILFAGFRTNIAAQYVVIRGVAIKKPDCFYYSFPAMSMTKRRVGH